MKIKLIKILIITTIPFIFKSFASIESKEPIDFEFERCIHESQGITSKMNDCSHQAYKKWDKELNKVYWQIIKNKKFLNMKKVVNVERIIKA